ncbi:major facilitator superfamily domain-containing protein [Bombardia bombarda]|uniref:Major facilitator superfamily domain-containing protein n=1 Tax=Bombardia bombarda TaxID=252184 RepID=A0AA39WUI7_9PEZI|nr:major facilitator superfamily domain-containing protein [Bombardia bombarda]
MASDPASPAFARINAAPFGAASSGTAESSVVSFPAFALPPDSVQDSGTRTPELSETDPAIEAGTSVPPMMEPPPTPFTTHSLWGKRFIVIAASMAAFFSPLTAQIYLPALTLLAEEFHVSNAEINLTVTTYMIFQGITPMLIGGFADTAGRRPAYVLCFVIYIAANIGLARCNTFACLLGLRCVQSAGSSTTVALAQAVVADTIQRDDRGKYIGITILPIILGPSIGPVIGGIIAQYLGWRWIFWFLAILGTAVLVAMILFFPETCRTIVGNGSVRAHGIYHTLPQNIKFYRRRSSARKSRAEARATRQTLFGMDPTDQRRRFSTVTMTSSLRTVKFNLAPLNLFSSLTILFEKELGIVLLYSALVFAGFYAVATALPSQFAKLYHLSDLEIGLTYLAMAGGTAMSGIVGYVLDWNYKRYKTKLGIVDIPGQDSDLTDFPIERARLEVGIPLMLLTSLAMIGWGWALQFEAHLAVPCVLLFLIGLGMIGFNNATNALVIDINASNAGAAIAANNLTRCLLGAGMSAAILPMIDAMGAGWAYFLIGILYVVFAPTMWLVMSRGVKWRAQVRERDARKKLKKKEKQEAQSAGGNIGCGTLVVRTQMAHRFLPEVNFIHFHEF